MILRSIYYALCALVLAGLVHIAIVLLIPSYGTKDAYAKLSRDFPMLAFRQMPENGSQGPIADMDPFFAYGVCRFDLSEEGVSITAPKIDTFWSATIVNEDGTVVYSLNNRTAIDTRLDLVMLNPSQILRLREFQPPEIENSIVVETDMKEGFMVLRVLRPDESWQGSAQSFLNGVKCVSYVPAAPPAGPAADEPAEEETTEPQTQ
ncbi:MAG: DUF1254 domain-containing protein [Nitratireductor sp.]|nr:DUF1254 domain-containing protein [Nitratireductor sp.]